MHLLMPQVAMVWREEGWALLVHFELLQNLHLRAQDVRQ